MTETERLRGRAGVKQRRRRLANEPLCRHCAEKGRTRIAEEVDHIVPLALGGADDDDNTQCLCTDCHAIKTASEGVSSTGAANHPDWLERSAVPLTIVCGPPCAGKTTYAKDHAALRDTVIDLDVIAAGLDRSFRQWSSAVNPDLLNKAIRVRNAMLGALARQEGGAAWFIVSAPTPAERRWWSDKTGGTVVLLDPGLAECKRRAAERGTPRAVRGAEEWYRNALKPWAPKQSRPRVVKGCDANGWPIDPSHPWNAK